MIVAFIASLIMGFLIGFFLEAAIGMIGFWFLEVSSLLFVYMLFSFFLSGHMFPLSLLPDSDRTVRELPAAEVPRVFSGGRVPGKNPRGGLADGIGDSSGLAGVLYRRLPRRIRTRCPSLQRLRWLTMSTTT